MTKVLIESETLEGKTLEALEPLVRLAVENLRNVKFENLLIEGGAFTHFRLSDGSSSYAEAHIMFRNDVKIFLSLNLVTVSGKSDKLLEILSATLGVLAK